MQGQVAILDDATIVRYLLGDLDEGATSAVEEQYFSSRTYNDHITRIEETLIRMWLAGDLGSQETALFERKYLCVPELRKKIAGAARLHRRAVQRSERVPAWVSTIFWRPALSFGLAIAFVAAAISTGWLFTQNNHLKYTMAQLRATSGKPVQARTSSSPQALTRGVFSLMLVPGVLKGRDPGSEALPLSIASQEIRLQLELPGLQSANPVAAELYRTEPEMRRLILSIDALPATPTPRGRTVLVALRPSSLGAGDYVVYVKPSLGSPASSALGLYAFSISGE